MKRPAAFTAAQVGLFVGVVMGGVYALLVVSDVLTQEPDFDLPGDAVFAGGGAFLFYGVLAFISSWAAIAARRAGRHTTWRQLGLTVLAVIPAALGILTFLSLFRGGFG